jgi:hypothetical protein
MEYIEVEKIKHNSFHRYISTELTNDLQREVISFLCKVTMSIETNRESKENNSTN